MFQEEKSRDKLWVSVYTEMADISMEIKTSITRRLEGIAQAHSTAEVDEP